MIPKIKIITTEPDYKLRVSFDSGETVIYDVAEDIREISAFEPLKTVPGLFDDPQLDESRTVVFWNDIIDIPSDTIFEYGLKV